MHWWDRVPEPIARVALRSWSLVPGPVRQELARLTPLINPGATTTGGDPGPGPDEVPGVIAARAAGFAPLEELTGRVDLASVWPEAKAAAALADRG